MKILVSIMAFSLAGCATNNNSSVIVPEEKAAVTIGFSGDILPYSGMSWANSSYYQMSFISSPSILDKTLPPEKNLQMKISLTYELKINNIQKKASINIIEGKTERCLNISPTDNGPSKCESVETIQIRPSFSVVDYESKKDIFITDEVNVSLLVEPTSNYVRAKTTKK